MNLYLVTCVYNGGFSPEKMDVYVIASNSKEAEDKALSLMKCLEWKYDNWTDNVKLLASTNTYKANSLLAM